MRHDDRTQFQLCLPHTESHPFAWFPLACERHAIDLRDRNAPFGAPMRCLCAASAVPLIREVRMVTWSGCGPSARNAGTRPASSSDYAHADNPLLNSSYYGKRGRRPRADHSWLAPGETRFGEERLDVLPRFTGGGSPRLTASLSRLWCRRCRAWQYACNSRSVAQVVDRLSGAEYGDMVNQNPAILGVSWLQNRESQGILMT
jgi:hypothetical protein